MQNMSDPINAVIFDLDGVLIDSYSAHFESWKQVAREQGYTFSEAQFAATFGRTNREIIIEEIDAVLDEKAIRALGERKEELYRERIRDNCPIMKGAVELVIALKQAGFKIAIGTSAPPKNVTLCLESMGCADYVDVIINGTDVTNGKPDPEVFLLAAQKLKVEPSHCAVIEDAVAGVMAAKAAGMSSLGLASTGHTPCELSGADIVLTSLRQLSPESIGELISRRETLI